MDIAFLGGVFEKNKINEIMSKSKTAIQFAADALQWNIIEGLDYCNKKPIKIINAYFIGSYPGHYTDLVIKRSKWSHAVDSEDINIGFINIKGIKNIFRAIELAKESRKWAKVINNDKKVIIAYSLNMPSLWAMRQAKKMNPEISSCVIVPDLPNYMNLGNNISIFYFIAKKIDCLLIKYLIRYVDSYVLLTKYMVDALKISEKPYCIVEGMINIKDEIFDESIIFDIEKNRKSILYTGTLNYKYGIGLLLEAFELIEDESIELWICGYGEAEKHIKELAETDSRIKWFGSVSRETAISLQKKATILINPRPAGEEFTKYSFPSKNIEYLASGRPVIAYKLPGIPDEYDEYIYYINGKDPRDMAAKIMEVCEKNEDELSYFGQKAKEFVLINKNNIIQTKKIFDIIHI